MTSLAQSVTRAVRIGGIGKVELLSQLRAADVQFNEAAETLFADERFATAPVSSVVQLIELTVAALGFGKGASFAQIAERAADLGLRYCPLEVGPHLRLQFLDQPEGSIGQPETTHQAPPGSMTIASRPLTDDAETPKGFYLRRISGVPWLRGFRAAAEHIYQPDDHFVFLRDAEGRTK